MVFIKTVLIFSEGFSFKTEFSMEWWPPIMLVLEVIFAEKWLMGNFDFRLCTSSYWGSSLPLSIKELFIFVGGILVKSPSSIFVFSSTLPLTNFSALSIFLLISLKSRKLSILTFSFPSMTSFLKLSISSRVSLIYSIEMCLPFQSCRTFSL